MPGAKGVSAVADDDKYNIDDLVGDSAVEGDDGDDDDDEPGDIGKKSFALQIIVNCSMSKMS